MLYQLMNKNTVVATYKEEKRIDDFRYTEVERIDPYLPYGFIDINDWIDGRAIAKHRTSIEKLMRELGLTTRHNFIGMIHCLSLTDTFWMKREDEALTWDDVSLYRNPFDDIIARIAFDGTGMYGRRNSPTSPEFATSGSFAKCWIREDGQISLLKRGSTGYANAGFEPYSEKLASDLLDAAKNRPRSLFAASIPQKARQQMPPVHIGTRGIRLRSPLFRGSFRCRRHARLRRRTRH